ncbi:Nucleoside diphosphate kinase 1 [Orobanche minor]
MLNIQRQPLQETMAHTFIMIRHGGVQRGLGINLVTRGRKIIGATNSAESAPGTISRDYAIDIGRNVIHGRDEVESARKEIALWFPEGAVEWRSSLHIYE